MKIGRELRFLISRNFLFVVTIGAIFVAFVTSSYALSKFDDEKKIPYLVEHDADGSSHYLALLTYSSVQITKGLVVSSLKSFITRIRSIPAEKDLVTFAHEDARYQTVPAMYDSIDTLYQEETKALVNFQHPTVDVQFTSFVLLRPNTWLVKWNEIFAHDGLLFDEKERNGVFVIKPHDPTTELEVKKNPWPFQIDNFYISTTRKGF